MQLHLVVANFSILLRVMYRLVSSYCAALQSLGVVARMMMDHKRAGHSLATLLVKCLHSGEQACTLTGNVEITSG